MSKLSTNEIKYIIDLVKKNKNNFFIRPITFGILTNKRIPEKLFFIYNMMYIPDIDGFYLLIPSDFNYNKYKFLIESFKNINNLSIPIVSITKISDAEEEFISRVVNNSYKLIESLNILGLDIKSLLTFMIDDNTHRFILLPDVLLSPLDSLIFSVYMIFIKNKCIMSRANNFSGIVDNLIKEMKKIFRIYLGMKGEKK